MNNLQIAVKAYIDAHGAITESAYEELSKAFLAEDSQYDDVVKDVMDAKDRLIDNIRSAYDEFKSSKCFNFKGSIAAKDLCHEAKIAFSTFESNLADFYKAYKKIRSAYVTESIEDSNDEIKRLMDDTKSAIKDVKHDSSLSKSEANAKITALIERKTDAVKTAMKGCDDAFKEFIDCVKKGNDLKNEYNIMLKSIKLLKVQYESLSGYRWNSANLYLAIDWSNIVSFIPLTTYIQIAAPHAQKVGGLRDSRNRKKLDSIEKRIEKLKSKRDGIVHESVKGELSKLESELNKKFKSLISALNNCKKSPSKYIDEVQDAAKSFSEALKEYYGECKSDASVVNESVDIKVMNEKIAANAASSVKNIKEVTNAIREGKFKITKTQLEEELKRYMSENITLIINALQGAFDNFMEAVSKQQDAPLHYTILRVQTTTTTRYMTQYCKFEAAIEKMIEDFDIK